MRKTVVRTSYLWLSSLILLGCVAPPAPYEDYTIARAAMRSAKEVDSARFAVGPWQRAEEAFQRGESAFKDSDFETAKKLFKLAKEQAEIAENATRLKKFKSGDSFP